MHILGFAVDHFAVVNSSHSLSHSHHLHHHGCRYIIHPLLQRGGSLGHYLIPFSPPSPECTRRNANHLLYPFVQGYQVTSYLVFILGMPPETSVQSAVHQFYTCRSSSPVTAHLQTLAHSVPSVSCLSTASPSALPCSFTKLISPSFFAKLTFCFIISALVLSIIKVYKFLRPNRKLFIRFIKVGLLDANVSQGVLRVAVIQYPHDQCQVFWFYYIYYMLMFFSSNESRIYLLLISQQHP